MTSPAITDSWPPPSPAHRPARECANGGAGRRERLHAPGDQGGDHAGEDVAGAGGGERRARARSDGHRRRRLTIVSSPFRRTIPPLRSAASRALAARCAVDLLRVALEQAAELPGVRGQDGRRPALGQPLEPAGVRVEPVGVDDQRRLDPLREPPGEPRESSLAAQPGAENDAGGALGRRRGSLQSAAASLPRARETPATSPR